MPTTGGAENPITAFTCVPHIGEDSRLDLRWEYDGPRLEGLAFRLFQVFAGDSLVELPLQGGLIRGCTDRLAADVRPVAYRLEVVAGDSVIAGRKALVPALTRGGFASFSARDLPNDGGGEIEVAWKLDRRARDAVKIEIYRSTDGESWAQVGEAARTDTVFIDGGVENHKPYHYLVRACGKSEIFESAPVMGVTAWASWFDLRKINLLIVALVVMAAIIYYVIRSGKRAPLFIRKIAGLNAVEEAVGRATEMGRSVLFIPGIQDLDDVQTIAGLTILGSVAKLTAEYETRLDVPVSRSLVMSNGREVVKEAYLSIGRPDFYHDDIVHYVTDEQFGYVAAVDGIMVREKPATCFYMGAFFAESLILAETGNSVGAIQIAGTAMPTQLPFFVAACDYTLIGEELFAASAYLSGDKKMIGSLRGQDVGKAISMLSILVGSILVTMSSLMGGTGFWSKLADGFVRLFALNY